MANYSGATCALERMPPEIRNHILLELTDIKALRSLVHASPSYHASYLGVGRKKVFSHIAWRVLDRRLLVDALAAVRSKTFYDNHPKEDGRQYREAALTTTFLEEYASVRGDSYQSQSEWLTCHSLSEASDLNRLHLAVKRVAAEYCLSVGSRMSQKHQSFELSDMEELRLHRALYRYQTYCNFFGPNPILPPIHDSRVRGQHPIRRFLPSFAPWEFLEMACIWHYLMQRWLPLLRDVPQRSLDGKCGPSDAAGWEREITDLSLTSRRLIEDRYYTGSSPDADDESYILRRTRDRHEYFVHVGPQFLDEILAKKPMQKRHDAINDMWACSWSVFEPFDDTGNWYPTLRQGLIPPARKYQDPKILTQLPQMPASEQPSGGWKWFCEKYRIDSLGIGPYVGNTQARDKMYDHSSADELRWGFPFWDNERLEMWGVSIEREGDTEP